MVVMGVKQKEREGYKRYYIGRISKIMFGWLWDGKEIGIKSDSKRLSLNELKNDS